MNTNFFNQIAQLDITGQLHLIIAKAGQGNLVVSVLPKNDACGDNAKNIIMPYNLTGTAQELDERFFENITAPVKAASGLMCNMAAYMKQLEVAQRQSAMEKGKADKEKKEQDTKEKRFKDLLQKVDELEKNGRFREAWTKLPDPALFPEQAEVIRKRRTALSGKFSPDLFDDAETEITQEKPVENYSLEDRSVDELPEDEDEDWEDDNQSA
ncbi:MAG: PRTRC system protein E [Chitinophagaceae bacterium]|nr:PRTRC system protein E [Chitinophagaceae bacterium]